MTAPAAEAAPPPRLVSLNVVDHPDNGSQVGIVVKRTYVIRSGRCMVADEQVPLVEVPGMIDDGAILGHDLDAVLNRRETDVIVAGKARPPSKTGTFDVRINVGALDRRLTVFGPRKCWRAPTGELRFSLPEPVDEIDLGWSSAYGGVDTSFLETHEDPVETFSKEADQPYNPRFGLYAYPRNRAGKGYLIEATDQALERCELPNVEDPRRLLTPERLVIGKADRWPQGPLPAGVGWLSYASFPRTAMLGMPPHFDASACPPESFEEVKLGLLKARAIAVATPLQDRFDLGAAQQSAIGMRIAGLDPGALVELHNCHPQLGRWSFALSRESPTMMLQMPGQQAVAVQPKIRTVFLEPERERVCVVWVGEYREPTPIGPGKQAHIKHGVKWVG